MFGNVNIIWASARTERLRSTCNILIAAIAVCDILHQSSHFIMGFLLYSGNVKIKQKTCFYLQSVPSFAFSLGAMLLFLTSLERLTCILKAATYRKNPGLGHIAAITAPCCLLPIYMIYQSYTEMLVTPAEPTFCIIMNAIKGDSLSFLMAYHNLLSVMTLLTYCMIWILIKHRKYKKSKPMLKSVFVVSVCVVGGWMLAMGSGNVWLTTKDQIPDSLKLYGGLLINLSVSANYVIYYSLNSDYRKAFQEQFCILRCQYLPSSSRTSTAWLSMNDPIRLTASSPFFIGGVHGHFKKCPCAFYVIYFATSENIREAFIDQLQI
ncbi:unnamed protein product [Bursaphelenchus xylophilus]|uniref:(pine wood nematode) hypothetical protein n=1 Tax=Bursaphelenchus xylophilus TaxID=6326 RepID=A0A1I7SAT8_BURXY|nr:unnamed protein product [Bursaphelenchus xylophilus]CAG9126780.1 unnamed protein product [Bursaphelenchus xylophilus]